MESESDNSVENLYPKVLWKNFCKLSAIPRESGNETGVQKFLKNFASERALDFKIDDSGNVIFEIPANPPENGKLPSICLQAHQDMVCVKISGSEFDFSSSPIQLTKSEDGMWVEAVGTTLGADNGIGLAAILAIAEESTTFKHPKIECLFTSCEEKGLIGASEMKTGFFKSQKMINLDSEEWGEFTVGCAGAGGCTISIPLEKVLCEDADLGTRIHAKYTISVGGLKGGHSGIDIHHERANAIKIGGALLRKFCEMKSTDFEVLVEKIEAKGPRNSIPRSLSLDVVLRSVGAEEPQPQLFKPFEKLFLRHCSDTQSYTRSIFSSVDDGEVFIKATKKKNTTNQENLLVSKKKKSCWAYSRGTCKRIALTLTALPNGVIRRSHDLEDIVETSNNVANLREVEDGNEKPVLSVGCMVRSLVRPAIDRVVDDIRFVCEGLGNEVVVSRSYEGWHDPHSNLVKGMAKRFEEKYGVKPQVVACHAGLECGVLKKKSLDCENFEVVSFGPTIENAHTPQEKVEIDSVKLFYEFLVDYLSVSKA